MDTRRARAAVAAVIAVVLTAAVVPAVADPVGDGPPRTILVAEGLRQRGLLGSYCWEYVDVVEGTGVGECLDTTWRFPRAGVAHGRALVIAIHRVTRPSEFEVAYWTRLKRNGYPAGRSRSLPVVLQPGVDGGEPVWEARVELPGRRGHVYIDAFGVWDVDPITQDGGDASWSFHVVRR